MDEFCFLGKCEMGIDKNNRVTLPVPFRDGLSEKFYLTMGLNIQCIWVLPEKTFRNMLQKFRSSIENSDISGQMWISHVTSNTVARKADKSWRFTIPQDLKEYAEIKDKVIMIGHDERLEIWGAEKWESVTMDFLEFTDLSEQIMKKYRINI